MARARTGTLEGDKSPLRDASGRRYWRGKVRLQDGSRARIDIPEPKCYSRTASRDHVAWAQQEEDETRAIYNARAAAKLRAEANTPNAAGESCDAWYDRFMTFRRNEVGNVDGDRCCWQKWIAPHIGEKPIRDVTPDDIENIRDALTAAVVSYEQAGNMKGDGRLASKSAQNVWTALTTPFKYASTRKGPRELRVREDRGNPCLGLPPPRHGVSKRRQWCRPGEVLAVVSSPAVPRPWREAIAIGCYLHLRPGELHELRVKDLDLAAGEVRISRAFDERNQAVKVPKTDEGIRHVTIPSTLMPLLERIARNGAPEDRVAPVVAETEEYYRAGLFRSYLKAAGVARAELYVETPTHLMIDFRSLRDSGITWRFLAGERGEVVQREAGHEQISTTLGYAKEVSSRGGRYGEPFPSLPDELIDQRAPTQLAASDHPTGHPATAAREKWRLRQDSDLRPTV
jgi:integrase